MSGLRSFVIAVLLTVGVPTVSRSQLRTDLQGEVALGSLLSSTPATPFWLRTNQYGLVPRQSTAALVQAAIWKSYQAPDSTHTRSVDWGFGLNPALTYDQQDKKKLLLPEAYAKVRFKSIEFYAGRWRGVTGFGDTTLSSGFYAVSGNALPIPKLQIGTVGYAPLHFTHDFLAINVAFSHGWYTMPSIQGVRFHQKYLYLRLGKPASSFKFYAGVNHQVQWAGHAEYLKQRPDLADANGYFPSDWRFYKYVVFSYTPREWAQVPGYSSFDSYRVGNSVGSIDFGLELTTQHAHVLGYYQHAYDDVSGLLFLNMPDGLWGFSYTSKSEHPASFHVNRLTLEFLTTKDQTAPTFYIPGSSYQGGDNYYNHSQYPTGWSYWGRTLGTPFIAPGQDFDKSYNLKHGQFFPNNRVNMWYVGLQATYRNSSFMLRTSYSRNYGTFNEPFVPIQGQFSGLLSAQIPLPVWLNTFLIAKVAVDNGGLYTKTVGGYVGLKKRW